MRQRGIFFILIVLIIPICVQSVYSYQESLKQVKQEQVANLIQNYCNTTYINITSVGILNHPYILLGEYSMTKNGCDYNFSFTNTSEIGDYSYCFHGDVDGIDTSACNSFSVTPTGEELTSSTGLIYFAIIVGIMIVFGFTMYGAIKMPFRNPRDEETGHIITLNNLKYLKIVLWVFAYLEFLFLVSIMKNLTYGYTSFTGAYQFFNIIYNFLLIMLLPFFPLLVFFTFLIWITDKKTEKMLKRGIRVE